MTVERLDPSSECDALVPSRVPEPVTVHVDAPSTGSACGGGVSEGTGHVTAAVGTPPFGSDYHVFGPDGRTEQRFSLTSALWPQPEGWQGLTATSRQAPSSVTVRTFFADGSPRRSEQPRPAGFPAQAAPDPLGGSLVVQAGPPASGQECSGEARRYDATGAPGAATRTGCNVLAVGVTNAGDSLLLEANAASGGDTVLRWLRADGTPSRSTTEDPYRPVGELVPLLDGSLVERDRSVSYTRRYPYLGSASEAAPAWLSSHDRQTFRFTRGNKGYAFFPLRGQSSTDCTQAVEVVAPSGRRCAKLTFRRDGNACVTGVIDQGWDGTVVQQSADGACGWRFWPGLLAGE